LTVIFYDSHPNTLYICSDSVQTISKRATTRRPRNGKRSGRGEHSSSNAASGENGRRWEGGAEEGEGKKLFSTKFTIKIEFPPAYWWRHPRTRRDVTLVYYMWTRFSCCRMRTRCFFFLLILAVEDQHYRSSVADETLQFI